MSSVQETQRSQRERLGQSRVAAAAAARLPADVPGGLESGELSLEDAATLAYVRIYARYLGLDAEDLLRDCAVDAPADQDWDGSTGRPPSATRQRVVPARVPPAIVLGVGLLCLALAAGLLWGGLDGLGGSGGSVDVRLGAPTSSPVPDTAGGDTAGGDTALEDRGGSAEPDAGEEGDGDDALGDDAAGDDVAALGAAATLPGRVPEETRVQILHHGSDRAAADEVRAVLEALG